MANAFGKEEKIAFETILEGFHDQLVLSPAVNVYRMDPTEAERSSNVKWRTQPYVLNSVTGTPRTDISSSYQDVTQLMVPVSLSTHKAVPWTMDALELRDALHNGRLGDAAKRRLASDINLALMNTATAYGSVTVKRTAAFTGFDDVAACDAAFNETGVPDWDRYLALSTRDYNSGASNLAARETMNEIPTAAFRRAYIGEIAGFQTLKLDYSNRATAAGGGSITMDTRDTATANFFVPAAMSTSGGLSSPKDNRFQTITVSATTNVAVGDRFTNANCQSVHRETKQATGQLKTFVVTAVPSGTTLTITPPIISGVGGSDAELQYKNCSMTAKSATAAITWLNTAAAPMNPFWFKEAIELIPGKYSVPTDAGPNILRATTDQGIEGVISKSYNHNTMVTEYACRSFWGTAALQTEMMGVLLCSQS